MKRTICFLFAVAMLMCVPVSAKTTIPKGAYGVWEVNSIHTESPLFKSKANNSRENQRVVDRENCALWWNYSKGHAIVDHVYSEVGEGLWIVWEMHIGDIATLTTSKGKTYYECTALYKATQTKYVYQYEGETITVKKGDILCVCCADEDGFDVCAYFKKLF